MKAYIVGGTGLLGSAAAAELVSRGHQVRAVALPPLPEGAIIPEGMEIVFGNHLEMDDATIERQMQGCDALVFAAGVDERVEFPPPSYERFYKYNVAPVERFLRLGERTGIRRAVVLGSYFCHFARLHPEYRMEERHPYVRSRIEQEKAALAFNDRGVATMVLELPYIFGTQPGRKPVWTILVKEILAMRGRTYYPRGGTAMVTVRQTGQAVAGALERGTGGSRYPVGWFNLRWTEMLAIMHRHMGMEGRRVVEVPDFVLRLFARGRMADYRRRKVDPGLDLPSFVKVQTSETFIDKAISRDTLGVTDDDIEGAIGDSIELCMKALVGKRELLGMKAE